MRCLKYILTTLVLGLYSHNAASNGVVDHVKEIGEASSFLSSEIDRGISLKDYLQESANFADHERIDFGLPDGSRGTMVPVQISRTEPGVFNNAGIGWEIDVPRIQIDRELTNLVNGGSKVFTSSHFGRLVPKADSYYPIHQNDDRLTKCSFDSGGDRWSCFNAKDNEVWHFGESSESKKMISSEAAYWFLTGIENQFGETIQFTYQWLDQEGLPLLSQISYPNRDLIVDFDYEKIIGEPLFSYEFGERLENNHRIKDVTVSSKATGKDLYISSFEYNDDLDAPGPGYLEEVTRVDASDHVGLKSPKLSMTYCYVETCRDNQVKAPESKSVFLNLDPTWRGLERAKYIHLTGFGAPSLAWIREYVISGRTSYGFSIEDASPGLAFEGETPDLYLEPSRPNLFQEVNDDVYWDATDFNGDSKQELWWVSGRTSGSGFSTLKIAFGDDRSRFSSKDIRSYSLPFTFRIRDYKPVGRFEVGQKYTFIYPEKDRNWFHRV